MRQATRSSLEKALARLSMGRGCRTDTKESRGSAPTRWVGESGVTRSGRCSSIARISRIRASVFVVGDDRIVEDVIAVVMGVQDARKLGVALVGAGCGAHGWSGLPTRWSP